jgi:hypothetical protein
VEKMEELASGTKGDWLRMCTKGAGDRVGEGEWGAAWLSLTKVIEKIQQYLGHQINTL